jgi:hypothetical protein
MLAETEEEKRRVHRKTFARDVLACAIDEIAKKYILPDRGHVRLRPSCTCPRRTFYYR